MGLFCSVLPGVHAGNRVGQLMAFRFFMPLFLLIVGIGYGAYLEYSVFLMADIFAVFLGLCTDVTTRYSV